jgi:hypothetical protein
LADAFALAVVVLAGQLHSQIGACGFDGYDEHRSVLAPPVGLLERHPGPDDLAGIRGPSCPGLYEIDPSVLCPPLSAQRDALELGAGQ